MKRSRNAVATYSSDKKLSNNLQNMKFMQRGKEAEIRDKLRAEREEALKSSQWVSDQRSMNK